MNSSLCRPALLLDSAHVVRFLSVSALEPSADDSWVARRMATIRVLPRREAEVTRVDPDVTIPDWLGTKFTREELQSLPYAEIRARLDEGTR